MSEPIRTSAAKRAKLATALKRNMARRKQVASHQSPVTCEATAEESVEYRVACHLSAKAFVKGNGKLEVKTVARGQTAEPAMSCDSTPHGKVSRPSRRQ